MMSAFNLSISSFKKPALFDWHDAGNTSNFNRIIETAKKKQDILDQRKNRREVDYTRVKLK